MTFVPARTARDCPNADRPKADRPKAASHRSRARLVGLAVPVVLAWGALSACGGGGDLASGGGEPGGSGSPVRGDLDDWLRSLEAIHPEPFHAVDRDVFVAVLDEIAATADQHTPAQVSVAIMRAAGLLARERDGHQFALPLDDRSLPVLPLQLYELPEGLVVTAARAPYEELTGSEVVAIGDTPVAEVLAAVEPLVPRDGPQTVATFRPSLVLRTLVLHGLGILDGGEIGDLADPVPIRVRGAAGEQTVALTPIPLSQHVAWAGDFGVVRLPSVPRVDYLDLPDAPLTWRAADGAVVIRATEVQAFAPVVTELADRLADPVARVVLDVRQNPGGNNGNNASLVRVLRDLHEAQPDVPIVVITDRVTFSAAANLVVDVVRAVDAVVVGEAMGGGLNFWNDVRWRELDALPIPMKVAVSTRYWQRSDPDDPRLTLVPDVPVATTWADLAAGRDPALAAALAVGR